MNQGIALWEYLMVAGPAAGTIWHDWPDRGGYEDMDPGIDQDGTPLTFARWYLHWLAQGRGLRTRLGTALTFVLVKLAEDTRFALAFPSTVP